MKNTKKRGLPAVRVLFLLTITTLMVISSALSLPAVAQGYNENVLYSFPGGANGAHPGNIAYVGSTLYGTTAGGGSAGCGVAYQISSGNYQVIHNFTGGSDGCAPNGGLFADAHGNLYGVTASGGVNSGGIVFELSRASVAWTEHVLHSFTASGNLFGYQPTGELLVDSSGNIYGATSYGGSQPCNCGIAYMLSASGAGYPLSVLYDFGVQDGELGRYPNGHLTAGPTGVIYGTTSQGGQDNSGVAFALTPSGNSYTFSVLHQFTGGPEDGGDPLAGLLLGSDGNLYGTTSQGGAVAGTVFRLTTAGLETILWQFQGGSLGTGPQSVLTEDATGALYGSVSYGGGNNGCGGGGCGAVFKTVNNGGNWTTSILYSFDGQNGSDPGNVVLQPGTGNPCGNNSAGGASGNGNVFCLSPQN